MLGYFSGAGERNRTLDLLITSELLYQLSYTGTARPGGTRRDCIVMKKGDSFRLLARMQDGCGIVMPAG